MIYLDNAATCPTNPKILDKYISTTKDFYGNASSIHHLGNLSSHLINKAREDVLQLLKLKDKEVVFLSSASEANSLAIKGYALKNKSRGNKLITSYGEHPSVIESMKQLSEEFGFKVVMLPLKEDGTISVADLKKELDSNTILVSLTAINNEVGSINPIEEVAKIIKEYPKCAFHVDAVQAIGKENIDYSKASLISVSAHKIGGLKGSGLLIKNKNIGLLPLISGGGQENNNRSGTEDVPAIACWPLTISEALNKQKERQKDIEGLWNYLYSILSDYEGIVINSSQNGSPFIMNFSLLNKKAAVAIEALSLEKIYVSSISACHSRKEDYSQVVLAMTNDKQRASNTIRVSFTYENTLEEVKEFIKQLFVVLEKIR